MTAATPMIDKLQFYEMWSAPRQNFATRPRGNEKKQHFSVLSDACASTTIFLADVGSSRVTDGWQPLGMAATPFRRPVECRKPTLPRGGII
jgi:hypothetical protein